MAIHILNEARAIDPNSDARTGRLFSTDDEESVFQYRDSASTRADIVAVSQKLSWRIAIVGLGGTGSYVLDLIAKTPAKEIHLFDSDIFQQHNAFRAPGAAPENVLSMRLKKVDYFREIYSAMHKHIHAHPIRITDENLDRLNDFDFVFVCVDSGSSRRTITDHLIHLRIPFSDVGMGLRMNSDSVSLSGTVRATMCTPEKSDHFVMRAPRMDTDEDDLYNKNIQVADMNALNAVLAIMQYKRLAGFYRDPFGSHHTMFALNSQALFAEDNVRLPTE